MRKRALTSLEIFLVPMSFLTSGPAAVQYLDMFCANLLPLSMAFTRNRLSLPLGLHGRKVGYGSMLLVKLLCLLPDWLNLPSFPTLSVASVFF